MIFTFLRAKCTFSTVDILVFAPALRYVFWIRIWYFNFISATLQVQLPLRVVPDLFQRFIKWGRHFAELHQRKINNLHCVEPHFETIKTTERRVLKTDQPFIWFKWVCGNWLSWALSRGLIFCYFSLMAGDVTHDSKQIRLHLFNNCKSHLIQNTNNVHTLNHFKAL